MANAATKIPPEEDEDEPGDEAPPVASKRASVIAFIGVMAILTALGVGSGGLLGLHLQGKMESAAESRPEALNGQHLKTNYPASMGLAPLTPIVASLSSPERTWIRLEAALVMEGDQSPEAKLLAAQIGEDIVAFLRTVPLAQIQGASGFQHLREDLSDRVRVRSGGKVRDLIIQTLIIE
jgi:flagellar FliL protein